MQIFSVAHHDLGTVRYQQLRRGYAGAHQFVHFLQDQGNIQCDAVSDYIRDILMEYAARKGMQGELAVFVDNRMSRVCPALKAYDDIRFLSQCIRNLALALIAPVGSDYCLYHNVLLLKH